MNFVKEIREHKKTTKLVLAAIVIAIIAAVIMTVSHTLELNHQVICAEGKIIDQPCEITVNGKQVAVLDSKAECKKVEKKLFKKYEKDSAKKSKVLKKDRMNVVDVAFKENVEIKEIGMKNFEEKPETVSVNKAYRTLKGTGGEKPAANVIATYEVIKERSYKAKPKKIETDKLYEGQKEVKEEGKSGEKIVTNTITSENGEILKSEKIDEQILEKAEADVVLVGTRVKDSVFAGEEGDTSNLNFSCPLSSYAISSGYGYRWGYLHEGLDMTQGYGAPIYAAAGGKVVKAEMVPSYGNLVIINHGGGVETRYAHCSSILVTAGQRVKRGQQISCMGSTGDSTGNHLHWEVRINGSSVDPVQYL